MQMLQTAQGLAPVRKQGKLVSVALVGSLHLAVIYTLLVALDIVPNPVAPTPPISIRVLPQTKTTPQAPSAPMRGVVLTHPDLPNPTPPPIDIDASLPRGPTAINRDAEWHSRESRHDRCGHLQAEPDTRIIRGRYLPPVFLKAGRCELGVGHPPGLVEIHARGRRLH
jgi:hypothetical protein